MNNKLLIVLFGFFISCGPPVFEKDTRVFIEGFLVDENNNPIPDIEISVYTRSPQGDVISSGGREFLLGRNYSEQDGSFSVISLYDQNEDFVIEIDGQNQFSDYIYAANTEEFFPEDFEFDLKTVTLSRLSNVVFEITRTSSPRTDFKFSFQYKNIKCFEFYDKGILNIEKTAFYNQAKIDRILNDNMPEALGNFKTLLGSEVEFRYSINNELEQIETFTIDNENYEFNFSY